MILFNKKDLYIGYSIDDFSNIIHILKKEGIKYSYKIISHSTQWFGVMGTTRGHFGNTGTNINFDKQYVISVKKDDYEQAEYLIHNVLHPIRK